MKEDKVVILAPNKKVKNKKNDQMEYLKKQNYELFSKNNINITFLVHSVEINSVKKKIVLTIYDSCYFNVYQWIQSLQKVEDSILISVNNSHGEQTSKINFNKIKILNHKCIFENSNLSFDVVDLNKDYFKHKIVVSYEDSNVESTEIRYEKLIENKESIDQEWQKVV